MAKRQKSKPDMPRVDRSGRRTAPIQVDKELARMAAVIASHDGKTMSDLLTPVIRQFIQTQYRRVKAEIEKKVEEMDEEREKDKE